MLKQDKLEFGELIDYLLDSKKVWSKLRPWQNAYDQWYEAANKVTNNTYSEIWEKTVIEIFEGLIACKEKLRRWCGGFNKKFIKQAWCF